MTLDWDRPGVLRVKLKVEEMAVLVAGARLAAAALAAQSAEQAESLERVLGGFDRALGRLAPEPGVAATGGAGGAGGARSSVKRQTVLDG